MKLLLDTFSFSLPGTMKCSVFQIPQETPPSGPLPSCTLVVVSKQHGGALKMSGCTEVQRREGAKNQLFMF